ncbi:Cap-specific mRNA (nucleoside-2'-O-)-methyltransferase 1-like [Oopsacas minuta]|uniref:Cap-specific mRNA (nucleoside-2'-O-)-methyltransferase 1 n=1 Tax=Oopsacas minuta TaxID=111878 RepID=A0AAV7JMJ7_9METZ|nr:Cap-specific mRNA (nucleoside-2'-O-)-methyltransferase 1-like [Oopsacas minuta]
MAEFFIDKSDSVCITNSTLKRNLMQDHCSLFPSPIKRKRDSRDINDASQPYIDIEDLTFQSSPSPDSSDIDCLLFPPSTENRNTAYSSTSLSRDVSTTQDDLSARNIHSIPGGYSKKVAHMMQKMGYKVSKGLGAAEQGSIIPVEYMKHPGRTGIGYSKNLCTYPHTTFPNMDESITSFTVKWLSFTNKDIPIPKLSFVVEPQCLNIFLQAKFIDCKILSTLVNNKNKLDVYDNRDDILFARKRCNPFETIGKGIFLNRAAMKIANIDAMLDYILTQWTTDYTPTSFIDKHEEITPFYFADLCAGPGGFSEYILFRLGWRAKGFGFTLRGDCDFKLEEFVAGTPETFEPHYGYYNDGDITKKQNLLSFQKYVFEVSNRAGVSLVMGDGGFDVKGKENSQEILTKQLVMCQFLSATSILHEGGNFVCKTFDLFTTFSVHIIYLMYRCFQRIAVIKPCTSRPANSERYLVCNGFKLKEGKMVFNLLLQINDKINGVKSGGEDVSTFLPDEIVGIEKLYHYILESNNLIAGIQNEALQRLLSIISEKHESSDYQTSMKASCFLAWHIPDIPRSKFANIISNPETYFEEFCKISNFPSRTLLSFSTFNNLIPSNIDSISEIFSWHCYPLYGRRLILVSLGRDNVYYWDCVNEPYRFSHISSIVNHTLELPERTIIEVLLVDTYSISDQQDKILNKQIWIIDIYAISNQIVCNWSRLRRNKLIKQLYQVIHKPLSNYIPMRPILSCNLSDLPNLLKSIIYGKQSFGYFNYPNLKLRENSFVQIDGILFTRTIKNPWIIGISKTHNKQYYFNTKTNFSSFEYPDEAIMDAYSGIKSRILWSWRKPQTIFTDRDIDVSQNTYTIPVIDSAYMTNYIIKRL